MVGVVDGWEGKVIVWEGRCNTKVVMICMGSDRGKHDGRIEATATG